MGKTTTNNTNTTTNNTTSSSTSGTSTTTTPPPSPACAACKYRRRRCGPNCPLAPHFPATNMKNFLNAHKLFGVSNIMKSLDAVPPPDHEAAVKSMILHANIRAADPVGGCHRIIRDLQRQIEHGVAELELTLHQLAICRAQQQQQNVVAARDVGNPSVEVAKIVGSGGSTLGVDPLCVYHPMDCYRTSGCANLIDEYVDIGCYYDNVGVKVNIDGSSSSMMANAKQNSVDSSEDVKPFPGIVKDKQPIVAFGSKELVEARDKIVVKEDVDSVVLQKQEDDLKE